LGNTFVNTIAQTALTGIQTLTTNTVTSAINAIQWDKEGGLSWDKSVFDAGVQNGWRGVLSGMTGTFTGGTFTPR
jgi:hypothetical protein